MSTVASVALVGHRADERAFAAGAKERLPARPQLLWRLAHRRQRRRADQLGLDRVARALQRDQRLERGVVAEVERRDLEAHCSPSAARVAAEGSAARSMAPGCVPHREAAVERGERQLARVGQIARAALQQPGVAGHEQPLGGQRGRILVGAELQLPGLQLVQAGGAERGQQVEAPGADEAGQREPLVDPGEAPHRVPPRLALERGGLGSRATRPRAVGVGGPAQRGGQVLGDAVRPRRRRVEQRALEVGRVRARERDQEREPGGVLAIGHVADLPVGAGRLEPRGGGRERSGEALGVGGRAQPRGQHGAVAVVGGAGDALGHDARARRAAGALGRRSTRRRRAGRRLGAQLGLQLTTADRAVGGQAVVAAEERHSDLVVAPSA